MLGALFARTGLAQSDSGTCATDGSDAAFTMEVSDGVRKFTTTGCPTYDWRTHSTPNPSYPNPGSYEYPTVVELCSEPTNTLAHNEYGRRAMGMKGIALDGLPIFGPTDAFEIDSSGAIGRDAIIYEGITLSHCGGHGDPMHYHALPGYDPSSNELCDIECTWDKTYPYGCNRHETLCDATRLSALGFDDVELCTEVKEWYNEDLPGQFGEAANPGAHSPLVGFYVDGIPLYGLLGSDGTQPSDLDSCGGHASDLGFYHYHATLEWPYLIGCLHGTVGRGNNKRTCTPDTGLVYDYSKVLPSWSLSGGANTGANPSLGDESGSVLVTALLASVAGVGALAALAFALKCFKLKRGVEKSLAEQDPFTAVPATQPSDLDDPLPTDMTPHAGRARGLPQPPPPLCPKGRANQKSPLVGSKGVNYSA